MAGSTRGAKRPLKEALAAGSIIPRRPALLLGLNRRELQIHRLGPMRLAPLLPQLPLVPRLLLRRRGIEGTDELGPSAGVEPHLPDTVQPPLNTSAISL